ncbi:MAG: hypothetical protein M1826_004536 [Phylliscum demangeonii]|nr:MAG: hypothetical protein M1826_004536 [Phylliscum demangeonii]
MSREYRALRPAPLTSSPPHDGDTDDAGREQWGLPRKPKRQVIAVACRNCRKRRSKCDGRRPSCESCVARTQDCAYEVEANETKPAALKRKNEALTERVEDLRVLVEYLRSGTEEEAADVLRRLRSSEEANETVKFIRQGALLLSGSPRLSAGAAAAPLPSPASASEEDDGRPEPRPTTANSSGRFPSIREWFPTDLAAEHRPGPWPQRRRMMPAPGHPDGYVSSEAAWITEDPRECVATAPYLSVPARPWTQITDDDDFVSHLVSLYFTWDQPFHGTVEMESFLDGMRSVNADGSIRPSMCSQFCSPPLVNAILAKACQLSFDPKAFVAPGDMASRGQQFSNEAARLLELEVDRPTVTQMQAMSILYTYHGLNGHTNGDGQYHNEVLKRLGLDLLRDRPPDFEMSQDRRRYWRALSMVTWGFYVRDGIDCLGGGSRPAVKRPLIEKTWELPEVTESLAISDEADWWLPYPLPRLATPSLRNELLSAMVGLTDLTHDVLNFARPSPDDGVSGQGIPGAMSIYRRLRAWKDALPECLAIGSSTVAHILLLQYVPPPPSATRVRIQFDAVAIRLLRPFREKPSEGDGTADDPRYLTLGHRCNALSTLWIYRANYTLARGCSIMQGLLTVAFALVFDLRGDDVPDEAFTRVCQALCEVSDYWPIAGMTLQVLKALITRHRLTPPPRAARYLTVESKLPPLDSRLPTLSTVGGPSSPRGYLERMNEMLQSLVKVD